MEVAHIPRRAAADRGIVVGFMDDIANRLMPGEKLLWRGQPGQGLRLSPRDGLLIPFSLAWCGFAVFWESTVARTNAPWFFLLWGAMFVAAGLYFVIGRFILDAWLRFNTQYAVTDRRVLILRSGAFSSFVALNREQLPQTQLTESGNGRGTIVFGEPASAWAGNRLRGLTPALDPTPQFIAIENARSVFETIQRPGRALA